MSVLLLNANPFFEADTANWTAGGGATLARSTTQRHQGVASLLITPDGATANPQAQSEEVPVVAGRLYTLTGWMRSTSTGTRRLRLNWFDAAHGALTTEEISTSLAAATWTLFGPTNYEAPALAAFARVTCQAQGTPAAANPWHLDQAMILDYGPASAPAPLMWSPGATAKIQAYLGTAWVDITRWVLDGQRGEPVSGSIGRQTELARIDPSNASLTLENRDGRFTPGNLLSPLAPWWKSGVPIRWSESLGARTFAFPDLYLEIPEVQSSFEAPDDPSHTDRLLRVQAVDLLTKLNRAPRFVSNLAAFVVGQRKTSLLGYWPMLDTAQPFANVVAGRPNATSFLLTASVPTTDGVQAEILPGDGTTLPGDDLPGVRTVPARDSTASVNSWEIDVRYDPRPTIAAGQVVTMVGWVEPDMTYDESMSLLLLETSDGPIALTKKSSTDSPASVLRLTKPVGTMTGSVNSTSYPGGPTVSAGNPGTPGPHIMAIRYGVNPNVLELWYDGQVYVGVLAGALTSDRLAALTFGGSKYLGSLSHGQVYLGDPLDFTNTDFLAQWQAGLTGYDKQRVDQRIRSVCNLAGVDDSQLDLEESDSLMPEARFANQRPGDLASSASETGGGILFTRNGALVYHDRKHRFDL